MPTRASNIKASGISVWLKADLRVLMKRVGRRDNRPLLAAGDPETVMKKLMAERYPIYAEADVTVESRDVPHEVIVAAVVDAIAAKLGCNAQRASPALQEGVNMRDGATALAQPGARRPSRSSFPDGATPSSSASICSLRRGSALPQRFRARALPS